MSSLPGRVNLFRVLPDGSERPVGVGLVIRNAAIAEALDGESLVLRDAEGVLLAHIEQHFDRVTVMMYAQQLVTEDRDGPDDAPGPDRAHPLRPA